MNDSVGDHFQSATKYVRGTLDSAPLDWPERPDAYKNYPFSKKIKLPHFRQVKTTSVDEAIRGAGAFACFRRNPSL